MVPRTVIKWNYVFLYLCMVISFVIFTFFVVLSSNTCRDVLSFKLFFIVIEIAPQWPGSRLVQPSCVLEDNLMRVNCVTCYIQDRPQTCETSSSGNLFPWYLQSLGGLLRTGIRAKMSSYIRT